MPAYPVDLGSSYSLQWAKLYRMFRGSPFANGVTGLIRSCAMRGIDRLSASTAYTDVGLIRFRGHLTKGGYGVQHGRGAEAPAAA